MAWSDGGSLEKQCEETEENIESDFSQKDDEDYQQDEKDCRESW